MDGMLGFDEDAANRLEAAYSTPDIVAQRASVLSMLALQPGEHVLDLGVGPGFLAAEMAAQVGPDGRVCGIDVSDSMLAIAAARDAGREAATLELARGSAEEIPYDGGSFDVVVTTQVLEYVPDVPRALAEIHRVLKPGGRVLILDTDWDSLVWHAPDQQQMGRVLHAWEEHLAHPHLPRTLAGLLARAGFEATAPTVLPLLNTGNARGSFSGILLGLVANFVVDRHGLDRETVDAWAASMWELETDWFFSLNRYVFLATRASSGFLEEAVEMARPPDQSAFEHAPGGSRKEFEREAAAERLREDRDEVRARLETMTRDLEALFAASADSNADDEHDPEGQTIAYERSQLAALIQGAQDHLAAIEAGMIRVEQGSYGICEVCRQPIPAARLDARPTARTCLQHATRR